MGILDRRSGLTRSLLILGGLIACTKPSPETEAGARNVGVGQVSTCCPESDREIQGLQATLEATPEQSRAPELALLPYRFSNGLESKTRLVVRDSAAWARVWAQIAAWHAPTQRAPQVDFGRDMIVIAGSGTQPTGGFAIVIDSVTGAGGDVHVWVREVSPGANCMASMALTSPVAIARFKRTTGKVVFEERSTSREC